MSIWHHACRTPVWLSFLFLAVWLTAPLVSTPAGAVAIKLLNGPRTGNIQHFKGNHWSSILKIYGEHRTPLPFMLGTPDDGFQDGTGTAPGANGGAQGFRTSVRGLMFDTATRVPARIEPAAATSPQPQLWDFWLKGVFTDYDNDDTRTDGDAYVLTGGVDYVLSDTLLVGIIAGLDRGKQTSGVLASETKLGGFIVGPYVSWRLNDELTFYARASWGEGRQKYRVTGVTGRSKSDRVMLVGSLKGTYWPLAPVRLTPEVAVLYATEKVKGFTDSIGNSIGSTRTELGRLEFGGEVGYRTTLENGYIIDPYIALHGLWDFINEGNLQVAAAISTRQDDFRGRIGGGVIVQTHRNAHINLGVLYDGIGSSDFDAFSAFARLAIPLD
ncbi:MAG: autotransporter outer membrane beta-barrel domain-containing protein [Pseudomonadota bacterium]